MLGWCTRAGKKRESFAAKQEFRQKKSHESTKKKLTQSHSLNLTVEALQSDHDNVSQRVLVDDCQQISVYKQNN